MNPSSASPQPAGRGGVALLKKALWLALIAGVLLAAAYYGRRGLRKFLNWRTDVARNRELAVFAKILSNGLPPAAESDLPTKPGAPALRETVNRLVTDVSFADLAGQRARLSEYRGKVLVVSMTSVGCPISKKLAPALVRLAEEFRDPRVQFLAVNADLENSPAELAAHAHDLARWRYVHDPDGRVRRVLGAQTTTESFVIDEAGTLRYRGAVNDQYEVGVARRAAGFQHLRDALVDVLENSSVRLPVTPAPGCALSALPPVESPTPVTWFNQIARLTEFNCVECHRPNEAAPFALQTYEQTFSKRAMIERVLKDGTMPPWFADHAYGKWRNDRYLSEADRQMFRQWVAAGCPKGDPAEAPLVLKRASGWTIRPPDVVLDLPPQNIPAEGIVDWVEFPVPFVVTNDLWVSEAEIKPSEPEVVHHAMLFIEYAKDDPRRRNQTPAESEISGGGNGFWLSYFPGRKAMILPPGRGKLIPRGGRIHVQMHYNPNGKATTDRTKIGLKLLSAPPEKAVVSGSVAKGDIKILPHSATNYFYSELFSEDVRLLVLMPHMHTRGAAAAVYLQHPDGRYETLLNVPKYDFNWQVAYEFAEPLLVTRGTKIIIQHQYDNTAKNPRNPDPTAVLLYGARTSDEMMANFFDWEPAEASTAPSRNKRRPFY